MAALTITGWELTPLNADGTDNVNLPSFSGTVPTNDLVEAAMGQKFRLEVSCSISGTYGDSSTADVNGALIRYNPALFVDPFSSFYPVGSFPQGGYSYQIPSTSSATYIMALMGQYENLNSAENGVVTIEVLTSTTFKISHSFRMTSDTENYLIGKSSQNRFRLSKSSQLAVLEGTITRPSVYGWDKALNAYISMSQRKYVTLSSNELSLQFNATFNGYDTDGSISSPTMRLMIERVSSIGTEEDSLSAYEDNLITFIYDDPTYKIDVDEATLIFTSRALNQNQSTFEKDLQISESKLMTSVLTTQIAGPIYNPVTYTQAGSETRISFVLKGTDLIENTDYQLHVITQNSETPSVKKLQHYMTGLEKSNGAPVPVDFGFDVENWSRNGNHANDLTITVMERCVSVLSMNKDEYDRNKEFPFIGFDSDIESIIVRVYVDSNPLPYLIQVIQKESDNTWIDTNYIGIVVDEAVPSQDSYFHAYLKEFRIPYDNEQGLQDWSGKTITIIWGARFLNPNDATSGVLYQSQSHLIVRDYESNEPSPSSDVVTNVRFLHPETGQPLSNWCDLDEILVSAHVEDIGTEVYVSAMVDKFPLGSDLFNDYALQEEDSQTSVLPDYVIFTEKQSVLISELTASPDIDGYVNFRVDISGLNNLEKMRIYVHAYSVEP